jgi:hypothetical protein
MHFVIFPSVFETGASVTMYIQIEPDFTFQSKVLLYVLYMISIVFYWHNVLLGRIAYPM